MIFQDPYKLIQSRDPQKRIKAVHKLGRKGYWDALELLEKTLGDDDSSVRAMAALWLVNKKEEWDHSDQIKAQIPGIQEVLKNGELFMRRFAINVLGKIRTPEAVDALISHLDKMGNADKISAIEALGKMGSSRAVGPLVELLNSKVGFDAADALGKIKDKSSADPLLVALIKGNSNAALALGKIGDERALEPLVAALNPAKGKFQDVELITSKFTGYGGPADLGMRVKSAIGLGFLGDLRAVEPLMETLSKANKYVRRASAFALGKLKDPKAIGVLIRALSDEDPIVMQGASFALYQIGSPVVEPLASILKEKDISVKIKTCSIIALSLIGDKRAIPALENLLENTKKEIETTFKPNGGLIQMKDLIIEALEVMKGEKSISPSVEIPDEKAILEKALNLQ